MKKRTVGKSNQTGLHSLLPCSWNQQYNVHSLLRVTLWIYDNWVNGMWKLKAGIKIQFIRSITHNTRTVTEKKDECGGGGADRDASQHMPFTCFFSCARGSSPFSLHVSTAPTNMSSKVYLYLNPKSNSFLVEKETFCIPSSTPSNLQNHLPLSLSDAQFPSRD